MPIGRLDHVNLRTTDVPRLVAFYERVLGLEKGKRPDFGFDGAWMYSGPDAVVHIVGTEATADYRGDQQLEHFALRATGLGDFLAHLRAENVPYKCGVLPGDGFGHTQVNIFDADGNHIHIDFPPEESADITEFTGT
ncbi:VOC family protein [Thalassobaculum sp.]|uniref:VOC family protein n=1 Tax=Thalassobaculum sp. TaxID=2022740 RepID=UPI0032EBDD56